MVREGLLDFFRFMPAAVQKASPQSGAPGMTQDVKQMITVGFGPTRLSEIEILSNSMREDPGTPGGETKVRESLTQKTDRTAGRTIPASSRATDRAGNSTQEMFDGEDLKMTVTAQEESTDMFVSHETLTVTPTHAGPETGRGSSGRDTGDPTVGGLRHGKHGNVLMKDPKGTLNGSQHGDGLRSLSKSSLFVRTHATTRHGGVSTQDTNRGLNEGCKTIGDGPTGRFDRKGRFQSDRPDWTTET